VVWVEELQFIGFLESDRFFSGVSGNFELVDWEPAWSWDFKSFKFLEF
jgi:hypothetical protein